MIERFDADAYECRNQTFVEFRKHHLKLYCLVATFIDALDIDDPKIIDAACGLGYGAGFLNQLGRYTGYDISEQAIITASARRPGVHFECADIEKIDSLPTADIFVCLETAEHLDNPEFFLKRVSRLLEPGGYLLFSAPTCLTMDFDPYHKRDLNTEQWESMLIGSGFRVLDHEQMKFWTTFKEFRQTVPTTWFEKFIIFKYIMTHWKYLVDRVINWGFKRKFTWTSELFYCQRID